MRIARINNCQCNMNFKSHIKAGELEKVLEKAGIPFVNPEAFLPTVNRPKIFEIIDGIRANQDPLKIEIRRFLKALATTNAERVFGKQEKPFKLIRRKAG